MNTPQNVTDIIYLFTNLIELVIPLVASIALLVFFWGLAKFIFNVNGDAKAVKDGKNLMIWGVVGLFVMTSIWGLVAFLMGEFGFGGVVLPLLPGEGRI